MTNASLGPENNKLKTADWELDFFSRPIIEIDGKKRWELLISSTQDFSGGETFRWVKQCPANEVNSIWLSQSLQEALKEAKAQGWATPKKLRCWRASMKTMIRKAADKVGLEVLESRRTFSLFEWLKQREKDVYPNETGYISGPIPPSKVDILNQPEPLPEALRGDAWSFSSLSVGNLREAKEWPMEFNSLLPIRESLDETIQIPGLRLFSQKRSLAVSAWLSGVEPVRLLVEKNQLLLEAGQEDRWLVTDMSKDYAHQVELQLCEARDNADGIQFIAIQSSPEEEKFTGFWMLKDMNTSLV